MNAGEGVTGPDEDIRTVIGRAALIADQGAISDYAQVFAEDVQWTLDGNTLVGIDALMTRTERARGEGGVGPDSCSRHMISTMDIRNDSAGGAHALTYFMFVVETRANPHISLVGTYRDRLHMLNGAWFITHRSIELG